MAFYNANSTVLISGDSVARLIQFEPAALQSVLIYNEGPDTVYMGESPVLDPTGIASEGFPMVKADTFGISWIDFAPGCRGTDPIDLHGQTMSGASATVRVFGFMKRVY